jgi:hypothetical protein
MSGFMVKNLKAERGITGKVVHSTKKEEKQTVHVEIQNQFFPRFFAVAKKLLAIPRAFLFLSGKEEKQP